MKTFSRQERWRSIAVIAASALAYGIIISFSVPLITLVMDQKGYPASLLGFGAAMPALGILVTGPFVPWLAHKLGALWSIVLGVLMLVGGMLLFTVTDNLFIWFLLRFVMGVGSGIQWMVSEIWISTIAEEHSRGRAVATYTTLLSIGFALGPLLIKYTGIEGPMPFLIGAAVIACSLLPLPLAKGLEPEMSDHTHPALLLRMFMLFPLGILPGLISGMAETSMLNFFPLYLERAAIPIDTAVTALSVFTAGSIASQIPLGWFADRVNKVVLITSCCLLCALGTFLVPLSLENAWAFWTLMFVWGGMVVGFYTVGLSLCAQQVSTEHISAANAAFVLAYTVGLIAGPPISGTSFQVFGPSGLMASLAFIFLAYVAAVVSVSIIKRKF